MATGLGPLGWDISKFRRREAQLAPHTAQRSGNGVQERTCVFHCASVSMSKGRADVSVEEIAGELAVAVIGPTGRRSEAAGCEAAVSERVVWISI